MSQAELVARLGEAFDAAGIAYMITGSMVTSLQGEPRLTHDVDVVVAVDGRIPDVLAAVFTDPAFYLDVTAARESLAGGHMFNIIDVRVGDKVDIWPLTDEPFDRSRFERRVPAILLGAEVRVSAPEDTILQKLKWAAASGLPERHVGDATGVYELQRGALDEGYLDAWASRLGVSDLLGRVREDADSDL